MPDKKDNNQFAILAKLIEQANKNQNLDASPTFGKCE